MKKEEIIKILTSGGIGVIPTDTQYGLVASALNQKAVKKVYQIRKRSKNKPFIILISSLEDLNHFNIEVDQKVQSFLQNLWPNPVSVILSCPSKKFFYLHRGTNSLAFRIPKSPQLLKLLKITGPLIAPSANFEGKPYAKTIEEAKKYFGENVDFYIDQGKIESSPSTLIKIEEGKIEILREGSFSIQNLSKTLQKVVL